MVADGVHRRPLIGLSGRRWPVERLPHFPQEALKGEEVDVHLSEYPKGIAAVGGLPVQLARESIRLRGDFVGARRVLTAAAGMAGQHDAARSALQELRRVQPDISLSWVENNMPIKHDADREHFVEGLRRAGLQ